MPSIHNRALVVASVLAWIGTGDHVGSAQDVGPPPVNIRGITELIKLPAIRDDLEVLDFQKQAIDKSLAELQAASRDYTLGLQGAKPEEQAGLLAKFKAARAKVETDIAAALLPAQLTRLKQVRMNMIVAQDGSTYGLNNREFLEELGLTDAQRAAIDAKAAEVRKLVEEKLKKLQAEMQKIKVEARDELLGILTPEQRKTYLDLVGRPFEPGTEK